MSAENRPDPDVLLARVQAEEKPPGRGKLKIFLGYAAGVGKTFAMLSAARLRKAQGLDVVAAYVETHGRRETDALLEGLETLPRKIAEHHQVSLPEMDLDAALARKPRLALVDELAHSNAPGSRHLKRWQDVVELLAAGIDVYSTLNVQHLESLNDVVAQITGIIVRETMPDRILDEADEIELVDLPPQELLQRLREGKVYIPEQASRALQKFFQKGNLIALRELALRQTANRVDEEMRAYMELQSISGPWPTKERLLVCVSGSPFSERLIRSARRLAEELRAEWTAVYVETPETDRLSQENREYVWRDMRLAESLGAKVATLSATSATEAVLDYARKNNITKIVVGKPARSKWRELTRRSFVKELIRHSKPFDVVVVSIAPSFAKRAKKAETVSRRRRLGRFAAALGLVAVATLVCIPLHLFLSPINLVMIYLLAVVVAALRLGLKLAIATAFMSVLAFDYFFVPPYLKFNVNDTEYLVTFAGFFTVGVVISSLVAKARSQAEAIRVRETQTASLYALSRDLAASAVMEAVADSVIRHVGVTIDAEVAILLPGEYSLTLVAGSPGLTLTEKESAVAQWVFKNRRPAGLSTDTLSSAAMMHLPLLGTSGAIGVLAIKPKGTEVTMSPAKLSLLDAFANQTALALERVALAGKAQQAQLLVEADKMHHAVMNSISHDLRTPLVTITGAISSLREEAEKLPEPTRRELLDGAWEEACRLNRFVGNLLEMSRLEAGVTRPRLEAGDAQDMIGSALATLSSRLGGRQIQVEVPNDLPLVPMDFVLMTQVMINLLDNAIKFSPALSTIRILARLADNRLEISVEDQGSGIPADKLERVFDKFYRVPHPDDVGGTGLGLAVCKGIVEAHGGTIRAEDRQGGGARLVFTLPL